MPYCLHSAALGFCQAFICPLRPLRASEQSLSAQWREIPDRQLTQAIEVLNR
jgi:hypothetical protein